MHGHFQLKYGIFMCHKNTQVKFRNGSIQIIFINVMHLALMYLGVRQSLMSPTFKLCYPRGGIRVASSHFHFVLNIEIYHA